MYTQRGLLLQKYHVRRELHFSLMHFVTMLIVSSIVQPLKPHHHPSCIGLELINLPTVAYPVHWSLGLLELMVSRLALI
jgi:hypothetical protein